MESDLDDISGGDKDATPWLKRFYFGIDAANDDGKLGMGLKARLASGAEEIDPRAISSIQLGLLDGGEVVAARVGRYGTYVQVGIQLSGHRFPMKSFLMNSMWALLVR